MKKCTVCGAVYPPNHAFCKVDGTALVDAPDAAVGVPPPVPQSWQPPVAKKRVPVWVWVLVGVGTFFLVPVLLMLLAIPSVSAYRKTANKISALKSIQAIQQAEAMYQENYPTTGYTCSLAALGGDPSAGAPSPVAAQLLKNDLTSGYKDGYIFTIGNCTQVTVKGMNRITSYSITAVPQTLGRTGDIGFCADDAGIKTDPTGGTNCTQLVQ